MVASSVASSSVRSKATAPRSSMAPHMLGGSKNLMSERYRREQAEQHLMRTRQSLKAVATDLVPQVEELTKAVQIMQIEKHHQLNLDEASQDVLEGLQQQLNEIEAREAGFEATLDARLEQLLEQMREDFRAEKYEMQVLVAHTQDRQDDLTAEVRLLQHELTATKEFLGKRIDAVDDVVDGFRQEMARAKEQHALTTHAIQAKAAELDEKLFVLDKELLKLKLALPSSVSAQLPPKFAEGLSVSDAARTASRLEADRPGGLGTMRKLDELNGGLDALKADLIAYRAADRQQFDAITNRLRENAKTHQTLKRDVDARLEEIQAAYDQMVTKVPSELSKRLLHAQSQWEQELRALRAHVQHLDSAASRLQADAPLRASSIDGHVLEAYDSKAIRSMDTEVRRQLEQLNELRNQVESMQSEMETMHTGHDSTTQALGSAVGRLEQDVLGLYDWTRSKITGIQEEVTFTSDVLRYFQRHAKILPKGV